MKYQDIENGWTAAGLRPFIVDRTAVSLSLFNCGRCKSIFIFGAFTTNPRKSTSTDRPAIIVIEIVWRLLLVTAAAIDYYIRSISNFSIRLWCGAHLNRRYIASTLSREAQQEEKNRKEKKKAASTFLISRSLPVMIIRHHTHIVLLTSPSFLSFFSWFRTMLYKRYIFECRSIRKCSCYYCRVRFYSFVADCGIHWNSSSSFALYLNRHYTSACILYIYTYIYRDCISRQTSGPF